ncbi:phosphatidylinositol N-acetylglucosaminyltransferase subunit Y-domain-containing protein [Syncephalis plumigaleata]|nr:phosphatidylinositol N-acetylglucosaminyltransferase subunit Y-domain-containing protein [Syncephalis plumigaleata]
MTSSPSAHHYLTGAYLGQNDIDDSPIESARNQYRHSAIITTTTTPIERVSTAATTSPTMESSRTRSMSMATDTTEHTNTLPNGRPRSTLLFGRVAAICNETAASSNYGSIEEGDSELRRRLTRGINMDRSHSTSSLSARSNQATSIRHSHNHLNSNGSGLSVNCNTNRFRAATTTHDYYSALTSTHTPLLDRELLEHSRYSNEMTITGAVASISERRVRPPLIFEASHQQLGAEDPDSTPFWGWILLIATYIMFVCGMYSVFISKWMPDTGSVILDWIRDDQYYCLLVPLSLPLFIYAVTCNWMGMKLFRHN